MLFTAYAVIVLVVCTVRTAAMLINSAQMANVKKDLWEISFRENLNSRHGTALKVVAVKDMVDLELACTGSQSFGWVEGCLLFPVVHLHRYFIFCLSFLLLWEPQPDAIHLLNHVELDVKFNNNKIFPSPKNN